MPAIIVSIKLAAIGIAIAAISVLVYHYQINEWVAIGLGVVAYIIAKAVLGVAVGYAWGRQDARYVKQILPTLPNQVRQDIINNAPSDAKPRIANLLNKPPN